MQVAGPGYGLLNPGFKCITAEYIHVVRRDTCSPFSQLRNVNRSMSGDETTFFVVGRRQGLKARICMGFQLQE